MPEHSGIKRYKVKNTWKEYSVTLEVNHEILVEERATMINTFWSGHARRLSNEQGDVVKSVIRYFGSTMIRTMLAEGGADFGVNYKCPVTGGHPGRYWSEDLQKEEGWGGNDNATPYGWCGIRVIAADVEAPTFDDVELEAIDHA